MKTNITFKVLADHRLFRKTIPIEHNFVQYTDSFDGQSWVVTIEHQVMEMLDNMVNGWVYLLSSLQDYHIDLKEIYLIKLINQLKKVKRVGYPTNLTFFSCIYRTYNYRYYREY